MILVFTNKDDVHPTPVIEKLCRIDVPVFRLNSEALLTDYHFCWWCRENGCGFIITNIHSGITLESKDLTAVWDRRPEYPKELYLESTEEINQFNINEAKGFLRFFRGYISRVPSIGSIAHDGMAESKMLQYAIAHKVGLKTPSTCFSNRKEDIVKFASKYEDVALKPIGDDNITYQDGSERVFFTQKVHSSLLSDIEVEAFSQTANFIQEYLPKDFELRVTVVYDRVFSCRIDSQLQDDNSGKIDWRQGYDKGLRHSIHNLPNNIAKKCIAFLEEMRLNYGAFDFIVTPSGDYIFLECNPNGQWLWIEMETGLKISDAIADTLQHPEKLRRYAENCNKE